MPIKRPAHILIRHARADDQLALLHLATLDSAAAPPPAPLLIAELDGEVKVALSLRNGAVIADPFTYTADIVRLLELKADSDRDADRAQRSSGRWRGRAFRLRGPAPIRRGDPALRSSAP